MAKIIYVTDSRISNTPVELGTETVEELERRICTLCEDYCIITPTALSFEDADTMRKAIKSGMQGAYRRSQRKSKK